MAARKDSRLRTNHREAIRTAMLRKRLEDHVDGCTDRWPLMDATQVTAALGLLKKTIPDLSAIEQTNINKDEPSDLTDNDLEGMLNVTDIRDKKHKPRPKPKPKVGTGG